MKRYLVGGVVRDRLLGRPSRDRDWVVVGSTPAEMLKAGYRQAGERMPVFIDPASGEEHALARRERKSGTGHKGFVFDFGPNVSLEDDLRRRDLTVNAMALGPDGELIDPCGGQSDLNERLLRHPSAAFAEDPLRVFRVARFAAELREHDFTIAPQTLDLMRQMAASGELTSLPAERVWRETQRALASGHPGEFFRVLQQCGALSDWLPELAGRPDWQALQRATPLEPLWRWAALLWPLPTEALATLHRRLRPPKVFIGAAQMAQRLLPLLAQGAEADAETRYRVLEGSDAFRRPHQLESLLQLHGLLSSEASANWWRGAWKAADSAGAGLAKPPAHPEREYARLLRERRLAALKDWR